MPQNFPIAKKGFDFRLIAQKTHPCLRMSPLHHDENAASTDQLVKRLSHEVGLRLASQLPELVAPLSLVTLSVEESVLMEN
jgi:hypothetical protein